MDLLGDIIEHNRVSVEPPIFTAPQPKGFPSAEKKKPSRWRQRLQEKGMSSISGAVKTPEEVKKSEPFYTFDKAAGVTKFKDGNERKLDYSGLSEEEQIHQENIEILARMSTSDREQHKQELLDSMDPKVLQMLINRSTRKYGAPAIDKAEDSLYKPVEGSMGTWVGGEHELDKAVLKKSGSVSSSSSSSSSKKIRFNEEAKVIRLDHSMSVIDERRAVDQENEWEDFQDIEPRNAASPPIDDDAAPDFESAKKLSEGSCSDPTHNHEANDEDNNSFGVHFPKPTQPYEELDINDPKFNDKLYEKYFPDLPKNPKQLEWMQHAANAPTEISYDSIDSVRFDFKGNIITTEKLKEYNAGENEGLHNHSSNPELPGYTLSELGHYLRSTFPGQVCIACRTLGRILYKLDTLSYNMVQGVDPEDEDYEVEPGTFEKECWKLIKTLQIIELLQKYAQESERNLSMRNYAIDALWLWRQGKSDKEGEKDVKATK